MAKTPNGDGGPPPAAEVGRKTCGIVMPIGAMGTDYSEEHWRRVKKIHVRAIERANMDAKLVWDNPEVDVIHSAILENLYENDVVVCDVSGLNPNVMLETGLRLSTKRPTVIVTDREVRPPFDISTIGYIEYQKDLEYNSIEDFIDRLAKKITMVLTASIEGSYKSFVEHFKFETVTPAKISVPAEQYVKEQLEQLNLTVRRLEFLQRESRVDKRYLRTPPAAPPAPVRTFRVTTEVGESVARELEARLDALSGFGPSQVSSSSDGGFVFEIDLIDPAIGSTRAEHFVAQIFEKTDGVETYRIRAVSS